MIHPVNLVDPARGLRSVGVQESPSWAGNPTKGRKVLPGRASPPKILRNKSRRKFMVALYHKFLSVSSFPYSGEIFLRLFLSG